MSPYSASLYNAVYLFAHAATRVLSDGGDSTNGTALVEAMRSLTFEGGPIVGGPCMSARASVHG